MSKGYGDHVVDQMHDWEDECYEVDPAEYRGCDYGLDDEEECGACGEAWHDYECLCLKGTLIPIINADCPVHGSKYKE